MIKMGNVAIRIRVMPDEASVDMEKLKQKVVDAIPYYAKLADSRIVPVAFGLKAIILQIIMPDQSPDELIENIRKVEDVENVEVEDLSLI